MRRCMTARCLTSCSTTHWMSKAANARSMPTAPIAPLHRKTRAPLIIAQIVIKKCKIQPTETQQQSSRNKDTPRRKDRKGQPGFFDLAERHDKLTQMRDPLVVLKKEIDWEAFRADLAKMHEKNRKSAAGDKTWEGGRMFKVLILQQTYNLSDEQIEYQIRDRLSFMRFLGLRMEDKVPDAKTVWLFREHLATHGLAEKLFARFHEQLARQGFVAKGGQMIDATFVEVPRQRNSRLDNEKIKAGVQPKDGDEKPT